MPCCDDPRAIHVSNIVGRVADSDPIKNCNRSFTKTAAIISAGNRRTIVSVVGDPFVKKRGMIVRAVKVAMIENKAKSGGAAKGQTG